jgi:hypothetical protein
MAKLEVVKKGENFTVYQDGEGNPYIRLDGVRASYPFLGTPSTDENDDGKESKKWRIVAMLPKKTHVAAKEAIVEIINKLTKQNSVVPKDRWFIKNGDESEDENMHGHWLVSASDGRYRPKCRDVNGQVIDDIDDIDNTFYGGCWVNVLIRPWFFDGKSKNSKKPLPKRVCAGISSVMFVEDDKPFGSGRIDDDEVWGNDDGMDDDDNRSSRRGRKNDDDDDDDL